MKFKNYLSETKMQPKMKEEVDHVLKAKIGRKNYSWQADDSIKFSTTAQASMAYDRLINDEATAELDMTLSDDMLKFES